MGVPGSAALLQDVVQVRGVGGSAVMGSEFAGDEQGQFARHVERWHDG
ncbi:hypothetical protein QRX50_09260 [Amycolatopsis carbonis]|uniref:Uncharacterized protein n=1 Tax=Amycolatopsis carbonis TaxID=715471 RepID=A0A9Y2IJI8_9PSEU|nr:hypothetical protein [Amycolatopsis sp. 2-15]WIX80927.1 hypothetical protein QRX50_09260 [Amycolatopsis sp. 2-15]